MYSRRNCFFPVPGVCFLSLRFLAERADIDFLFVEKESEREKDEEGETQKDGVNFSFVRFSAVVESIMRGEVVGMTPRRSRSSTALTHALVVVSEIQFRSIIKYAV